MKNGKKTRRWCLKRGKNNARRSAQRRKSGVGKNERGFTVKKFPKKKNEKTFNKFIDTSTVKEPKPQENSMFDNYF